MPTPDPLMAAALRILRVGLGLEQQDVATRLGVCRSTISHWERGRIQITPERLHEVSARLDAPEAAIDAALAAAEVLQRLSGLEVGPGSFNAEQRRVVERAVCQVARDFRVGFTASAREALIAADRAEAEDLARELLAALPAERRETIRFAAESTAWALCEKLCAESERVAASAPRRAIEIAELALGLAERVEGSEAWRREVAGYCWLFAANAHRAANDFRRATVEFGKSRAFAPSENGSGVLDFSRRLDLEASLFRDQRNFPQALALLDRALLRNATPSVARARLLLKKSFVLEQSGEIDTACQCLSETLSLADASQDPRLRFGVRLNLAVNLLHLGKAGEAAGLVPQVRSIAIDQGEALDLTRVLWLEGRLFAAQGSRGIAREMLAQARGELAAHGLLCDAALVALEESALDLEEGNFARVEEKARPLPRLFAAQGIERESLMAIRLFVEAVERERATAAMARSLAARLQVALRGFTLPSP